MAEEPLMHLVPVRIKNPDVIEGISGTFVRVPHLDALESIALRCLRGWAPSIAPPFEWLRESDDGWDTEPMAEAEIRVFERLRDR